MMTPREKQELYILLNALCEGSITDEQFDRLDAWLKSDKEACRVYVDFTSVWSDLQYFHASTYSQNDCCDISVQDILDKPDCFTDSAIWKALADAEKGAPTVEITPPEEPKVLIQKVQREKVVRKISKGTIFTLCTAAAAIILILVFAYFAPNATGIKVAVLLDTIDAKWSNTDIVMEKGLPLFTSNNKLVLRDGYAKLMFDNKAQVTIEGPAEFQILAEDKINVGYGRVYAIIPHEAIGFMVTSQNAKIIDLGTEFGVEVNPSGDTSLHVMKGRTTLIAGDKSNKLSMDVTQGLAKRVSAVLQDVKDISCNERLFARDIDSANEIIWRGEVQVERKYVDWAAKSGNWSDNAGWNTGIKPDGTRYIRLRGNSSTCVLNTAEKPVSSQLTVTNGQILNIENGGYIGCGWSRFAICTVNMTGNGTWLLNNDDLYIGYPIYNTGNCVWTMSDTSTITINEDTDNEETLYIAQDDTQGTLKIIGSGITVNCDQMHIGYVRNQGFAPQATLEYVMNSGGVSTIHVGHKLYISEGAATAHLLVSAAVPLPAKDLVLIETQDKEDISGDGAFDTLNGGPASEGAVISMGGNRYRLTYQYDANGDGDRNDVALVYEKDPQQ